jgi:hypothetical protein
MSVFDAFCRLGIINLHDLNGALLVLLPKSKEATSIRDYRPIALIHLRGKLISKVLAKALHLGLVT